MADLFKMDENWSFYIERLYRAIQANLLFFVYSKRHLETRIKTLPSEKFQMADLIKIFILFLITQHNNRNFQKKIQNGGFFNFS
jgi:hypothetical protein